MKRWDRPEMERVKVFWSGKIISIQPRIRLTRSFDQRSHNYLGYLLTVQGLAGGEERTFIVAIGKEAQAKHQFETGDIASGRSEFVEDVRTEVAEYYKTSELKLVEKRREPAGSPPPWMGLPPPLEIYRQRGHRRLDPRTYTTRCAACILGCRMAVEMIIDHWNPRSKTETISGGDLLLRPSIVSFIQSRADPKGSGKEGHDMGRRRLD